MIRHVDGPCGQRPSWGRHTVVFPYSSPCLSVLDGELGKKNFTCSQTRLAALRNALVWLSPLISLWVWNSSKTLRRVPLLVTCQIGIISFTGTTGLQSSRKHCENFELTFSLPKCEHILWIFLEHFFCLSALQSVNARNTKYYRWTGNKPPCCTENLGII